MITGSGAAGLTRTDDLTLTKRLLYQLSYSGVPGRILTQHPRLPHPVPSVSVDPERSVPAHEPPVLG